MFLVEFAIILMCMTPHCDPDHKKFGDLGEEGTGVSGEGVEGRNAVYDSVSEKQRQIGSKD